MYTAFASVYDRLMADVDYQGWARFYHSLMERYGIRGGKVCECACGTGSITICLSRLGYQMTGVDLSPDMLFEASQKARRSGAMIPFVKQDMRTLRLHRQMDAVLCTNDGLNYLKDAAELTDFFRAAWMAIRPGGGLFLDLSTPYKLENVLGDYGQEDRLIERFSLDQAIKQLPQREQMVISLRFFHGLTQDRTSKAIGVSQVQVSRLEKRAIDSLRDILKGDL